MKGPGKCVAEGGARVVSKERILSAISIDFHEFCQTRYSVRDFSGERVTLEAIRKAIDTARKTPSVCNRQSWRVHAFSEPSMIEAILKGQTGYRGLVVRDVAWVLVVTCDLSAMMTVGERNQGYIDGGMYAMSLLYALHAEGLGACCLNLSLDAREAQVFRRIAHIEQNEILITRIAVGSLKEEFTVACSPRKSVDETLVLRKASSS